MKLPAIAALAALAMIASAAARDNGQWADSPGNIRQWLQSLMQPDNPTMSCCGEAEAFEADTLEVEGDHYVAVITDGKGLNCDDWHHNQQCRQRQCPHDHAAGDGAAIHSAGHLNLTTRKYHGRISVP